MYGTNLKFALYGAIIANFFLTPGYQWYCSLTIYIGVQVIFGVVIGFVESFSARFRINHNPQFILMFTSISLLIFLGVLLIMGNII
jgi:formate hydrogenlyase subunit 4